MSAFSEKVVSRFSLFISVEFDDSRVHIILITIDSNTEEIFSSTVMSEYKAILDSQCLLFYL